MKTFSATEERIKESEWTTQWDTMGLFVQLCDETGHVIDASFHDMEHANEVRDAHNSSLRALEADKKRVIEALKQLPQLAYDTIIDKNGDPELLPNIMQCVVDDALDKKNLAKPETPTRTNQTTQKTDNISKERKP